MTTLALLLDTIGQHKELKAVGGVHGVLYRCIWVAVDASYMVSTKVLCVRKSKNEKMHQKKLISKVLS